MEYRLDKDRLLDILREWNRFLKRKVHLIACGGTAMTLVGAKPSTKDVDFIVPEVREHDYLTKQLKALGYKQTTGVFHTMRGQPFKQVPLFTAFPCGFRIAGSIAPAAVQEAVVGARSPGINVLALHQDAGNPPQGQVTGKAGTGCPAADNQHLCFQLHCFHVECRSQCSQAINLTVYRFSLTC